MILNIIKPYAQEVKELLSPYCKRIEIAGSIRRQVNDCKDIDIVCIADKWKLEEFFKLEADKYFVMESEGARMKRFKYKPINIDLYICKPENWGFIYMVRTGNPAYNIRMIAALKKKGYTCIDGHVRDKFGDAVNTPEERDIFDLLGVNPVEPIRRSVI